MIEKEFDGQITINMAETPEDTIKYYAVNEISGIPIVITEENENEKQT